MREPGDDFVSEGTVVREHSSLDDGARTAEMIVQNSDRQLFGRAAVVTPGEGRRTEVEARQRP